MTLTLRPVDNSGVELGDSSGTASYPQAQGQLRDSTTKTPKLQAGTAAGTARDSYPDATGDSPVPRKGDRTPSVTPEPVDISDF